MYLHCSRVVRYVCNIYLSYRPELAGWGLARLIRNGERVNVIARFNVSTFADFKNVLMEGSRKERTVIGKAVVRNSFVLFFYFLFFFI